MESRGSVGLINMDRLKESKPRSGCVRGGPLRALCFYGAVDGTLKSWLAQGWNCLVPRVGAWPPIVGEKQASGKAQGG